MSIHNYDETIDYIENNITQEKEGLSYAAEKILNIEGRKAGEFFSYIEPENRTLKKYIRDRKLYCALADFITGCTAEEIVEKYGISDPSRFSSDVKLLVGKYPKVLRAEKYEIPKVQHLSDILNLKDYPTEKTNESSLSDEEKERYITEIQRLITENYELRDDITKLRIKEIDGSMNYSAAKKSLKRPFTKEEYMQFLRVEDCRRMYGFDVEQILKLFKESLQSKRNLESLCEDALFDFRFEYEEEMEQEKFEFLNSVEALQYYETYEMNSKEANDYYYGDDSLDELEEDPYARGNEYDDWESPEDINPEDAWEWQVIEMYHEDELVDKQLDEMEDTLEEIKRKVFGCDSDDAVDDITSDENI